MKIIFMGTPEFSVPTLKELYQHHQIVAVYTQAPKPAGRGHKETLSPVHILANQLNIPVYTPKTLRNEQAKAEFAAIEADLAVVIAYGLILPKEVLQAHKYGCINIHPSMLPFYRGAAPMQRTIEAMEEETAMCIMQMDEGVDTGDILHMEKIKLREDITYPELAENMAILGAKNLLEVLKNIDIITSVKQPVEGSYASKITKEEGELDWNESAKILAAKVRAFSPWPGTYFFANGEKIKVLKATYNELEHTFNPGEIIDEKNLIIACRSGVFKPLILQRPGKNPIAVEEFMRGCNRFILGE